MAPPSDTRHRIKPCGALNNREGPCLLPCSAGPAQPFPHPTTPTFVLANSSFAKIPSPIQICDKRIYTNHASEFRTPPVKVGTSRTLRRVRGHQVDTQPHRCVPPSRFRSLRSRTWLQGCTPPWRGGAPRSLFAPPWDLSAGPSRRDGVTRQGLNGHSRCCSRHELTRTQIIAM